MIYDRHTYRWPHGRIGDVKHDDLPLISGEEKARALMGDIVELLCVEHGYRRKDERGKSKGNGHERASLDYVNLDW